MAEDLVMIEMDKMDKMETDINHLEKDLADLLLGEQLERRGSMWRPLHLVP